MAKKSPKETLGSYKGPYRQLWVLSRNFELTDNSVVFQRCNEIK